MKSTQEILSQGGKTSELLAFIRPLRQQARDLYLINWQTDWSIASETRACDASPFCLEISHSDLLSTFRANTRTLSRLVTQAVNKLRAVTDTETLGTKYLTAAKEEVRLVNTVLSQFPTSDTQCS